MSCPVLTMESRYPCQSLLLADETCLDDCLVFDIGSDQFASDHFRMYDFKVKRCPKTKPHDWTQCPFAHCGERATRRDPLIYKYCGSACAEFRRNGTCSRGDVCTYSHGVFECWLHPSKYKTQMCSDVDNCKRLVCFFAHKTSELRVTDVIRNNTSELSYKPSEGLFCNSATLNAGQSRPIMKPLPPLVPLKQPLHIDPNAAMYAPLQQSACTGASAGQNPFEMLVSALQQIQLSMPGVSMLQLFSAVNAGQQPANQVPQPPAQPDLNSDLAAALMQAQVQALQTNELMRQMQRQLSNNAPLPSMPMPPPLPSQMRDPMMYKSTSMPLHRHDQLYPDGMRSSFDSSASFCVNPPFRQPNSTDSSPAAPLHSAVSPFGHQFSNASSYWNGAEHITAAPGRLKSSESTTGSADRISSSLSSFDMWGTDHPTWCNGSVPEQRPPQKSSSGSTELVVDSASSSRGNSSKLSPVHGQGGLDISGDALLDALPRDLCDLKLTDIAKGHHFNLI